MSFLEMLRTTVSSLSAHKLRTALSVLGILIGVASVIATSRTLTWVRLFRL